ncbi:hypothetical protein Tco_0739939, partial [Tanacetum coccineum]
GTEIHMLAKRRYPLIRETLEKMMELRLTTESEVHHVHSNEALAIQRKRLLARKIYSDWDSQVVSEPVRTPTPQASHTLSAIKLHILKKVIKVLPPKTAKEILARERERKARTTLLMALPEDHLAKFHKMTDAKEMLEAIKSRFGGNDESKKMQKYILKQLASCYSNEALAIPEETATGKEISNPFMAGSYLAFEDGTEFNMLAERRFIQKQIDEFGGQDRSEKDL